MSFGSNLNDAHNYLRCLHATLRSLRQTQHQRKQLFLEKRITSYQEYLLSTLATLENLRQTGFVSNFDVFSYRKVQKIIDEMLAFNRLLDEYRYEKNKTILLARPRRRRYGWVQNPKP